MAQKCGKLWAFGCRFSPKSVNFGTLGTQRRSFGRRLWFTWGASRGGAEAVLVDVKALDVGSLGVPSGNLLLTVILLTCFFLVAVVLST